MTDHLELENSVAALVLGAAPEEETAVVRAHLAGCAECRQLAARLQRAAGALPLATDLVEPPARLKSRIRAAAAATARTPATQPPGRARRPTLRRRVVRGRTWSRHFPATFQNVALAALVLSVIGLGGWSLYLANQVRHQHVASEVGKSTLVGRGEMTGARATVVDFRDQGVALVTFSLMPAPPPGKIYEVWLIPASGPAEGVAVFQPDPDGSKTLVLNYDLRRYRVIAVTVEQGPAGVAAPTQTPSLSGSTV